MIRFESVCFSYGGGPTLTGLDLEVAPGSLHLLTGPSGAGKSTVLRLCHLALRPSAGRLQVLGADAAAVGQDEIGRLRRRMGMVLQDGGFLDHLTVAENVGLPLRVAGRAPRDYAEDLDDLLAWTGLAHRRDARPPELSGGERQRAALARAMIASPDVILADEPTGGVDRDMAARILHLFVELNRMGRTLVVATHDSDLIRGVCAETPAHVHRLRDGRLFRLEAA